MFVYHAAPCSAGDYMTASGCQECGENSYSGDGASSCTSCPDDKVSAAGSASQDDCEYGKIIGLSIQTIHYWIYKLMIINYVFYIMIKKLKILKMILEIWKQN